MIIKTAKVINSQGKKCRQIVGYEGILSYDALPLMYTQGYPTVYITGYSADILRIVEKKDDYRDIRIGCMYTDEDFQRLLKIIKAACRHLHEVNTELRQLKKIWSGEETYIV